MPRRGAGPMGPPDPAVPVYVISVASELTGLHPQTLRTYDRLGIVSPGRTGGGGRRYSWRDIEQLREVVALTAEGLGLEGVRRVLRLQQQVQALSDRVVQLEGQLADAELAVRAAAGLRTPAPARTVPRNLPVLRNPAVGQSVTVWRRSGF